MSFSTHQIAKVTSNPPQVLSATTQSREQWDRNFDDAAEALFSPVWQDEDVHPARAMRLREILGRALLGDLPKADDFSLLLSVVDNTRSEMLRDRAYSQLAFHLREGVTDDYKTEIADLLAVTPTPPHWIQFPILVDKTRAAIAQHKTPPPK